MVCYAQHMPKLKPNRYRKNFGTTLDPDTAFIIESLSKPNQKGQFLDEVIYEWLLNCAWFQIPVAGIVNLKYLGLSYVWEDPNSEACSPEFKTPKDALIWLKKTYPESNQELLIFEE